MTRYFLTKLSVEGFRGINNENSPLVLKFDAKAVNSVFAANGMGKSSLYDALYYAIRGSIPRLSGMQASEGAENYYVNLFHGRGESTIGLTLTPDDGTSSDVELLVKRSANGTRSVSSSTGHGDPEGLLKSLDQEFTLLDYSTFLRFIEDTALDRGRSFSALLGLADYADFRRILKTIDSTQTFNSDFGIPALQATIKAHTDTASRSLQQFSIHYSAVTGKSIGDTADVGNWATDLLTSIGRIELIAEFVSGKKFSELDFDAIREHILATEGGPLRLRLSTLTTQRAQLNGLTIDLPRSTQNAAHITEKLAERDALLQTTKGENFRRLFDAAHMILEAQDWDSHVCPLCSSEVAAPIDETVTSALAEYAEVRVTAGELRALVSDGSLLRDLSTLESSTLLEIDSKDNLAQSLRTAAAGVAVDVDADNIAANLERLSVLWISVTNRISQVADAILELEKQIPPSLVELSSKVADAEAARVALTGYWGATAARDEAKTKLDLYLRWQGFMSTAYACFSKAESDLSTDTFATLQGEYQQMFAEVMSTKDIVPILERSQSQENLSVQLSNFHEKQDLSARALLSESYRNALAISVFLSAAVRHSRAPRFIVLDDATSSFDSGNQFQLMEQIRTRFQYPTRLDGLQFIILSHDVTLEKYFDRLDNDPDWKHQKLQGFPPHTPVTAHAQSPDRLRAQAEEYLKAGLLSEGAGLIRQYLEFVLQQIINRVHIPVPMDLAVNDHSKMVGTCLAAIVYAVEIHEKAGVIILEPAQIAGLKGRYAPAIVANWVSHYGTSAAASFSPPALLGVLASIDELTKCFQFDSTGSGDYQFYKSLTRKS